MTRHVSGAPGLYACFIVLAATEARAEEEPRKSEPDNVTEALEQGKPSVALRYRYEDVHQKSLPRPARASTLRTAIGYETLRYQGFGLAAQFEATTLLGPEDFRVPGDPRFSDPGRPVIADPDNYEINRAVLSYESASLKVKLGRQGLILNNARFVGIASWRQNTQSFDGALAEYQPGAGFTLSYAHVVKVNRVFGKASSEGALSTRLSVLDVVYEPGQWPWLRAAAYGVLFDAVDRPELSTGSLGLRIEGPVVLSEHWALSYAAEVAYQRDVARNPNRVAAKYYLGDVGIGYSGISVRVQYNVREGSGPSDKFSTPITHPWDGLAEMFAATPDGGLRTASLTITGKVPSFELLAVTAAALQFWGQSTGGHYGSEVDGALELRPFLAQPGVALGARAGFYQADRLFGNTRRWAAYAAYAF